MELTFLVLRDGNSYTIYREPAGREQVCNGLPLKAAKAAFAEYCQIPINEVPPIAESGYWKCRRPVTRLGDVL